MLLWATATVQRCGHLSSYIIMVIMIQIWSKAMIEWK